LDIFLDHSPSDLVPEGASDVFQLRELRASGQTVGVDLPTEFPSHLVQTGLKLHPNGNGILAHVLSPH
jgi:hypothetical protein